MDLIRAVPPSSMTEQDPGTFVGVVGETQSSVRLIQGREEDSPEADVDSKRPRKTAMVSQGSAIMDDPKAPGWTRRRSALYMHAMELVRLGDASAEELMGIFKEDYGFCFG